MADMYLGNESGGFDLVGTTNIKNIDFEEAKISKEDYEKLSEEEKKSGIYLVTGLDDTEDGGGRADLISYDNTNSGLGSTNVQGAIDELNSNLNGITFGYTEDGKAGVIVKGEDGADSVIPFIDTSNATATADLITEGYTAWVNGKLIVGTRPFPSTYQSGYYVTERLKYGASATYRVNFEKAFVSPPTVVVSSDNGNIRMSVSGTPTTTYFNLYCINQGNGSSYQAGCTWKATGIVAD